MADIAASVLTRLKNKAQASGRSYQLCLQLFCQEEFLRRLEKSKYAENFVLKGGLFIYSLTEFDSRVTVDVDFLLRQMPNTPEQLRAVLEEIIAAPTENEFITFEITDVSPIAVAKKYAGIGASLVAHIKNTRTPFSIDFGVGDVIVPKQEKRKIPTQLDDFTSPTVNTYSLETTIAEKLDAILDLMEFSSRMKDYYDIYYLANKFDFDGATLTKALKKTFENRGHAFTIKQFEQVKTYALFIKKRSDKVTKIQDKPIWMYIIDNDGLANSDKRFPTKLRNNRNGWMHDEISGWVSTDGIEMPGVLEKRWLSFDDSAAPTTWIDEKGIVQTARKGGNVDINIIENDHYKTLLPEYYLRPYSPHYISENDFDNELKQIDNS